MKVRFKKDYVLGRVDVKEGEILDLPDILAQDLIEKGIAEKVDVPSKEEKK